MIAFIERRIFIICFAYIIYNGFFYDYVLNKIKRSATECLFIDDAAANIAQADKMGFVTHHFTTPDRLAQHLQQLGVL